MQGDFNKCTVSMGLKVLNLLKHLLLHQVRPIPVRNAASNFFMVPISFGGMCTSVYFSSLP